MSDKRTYAVYMHVNKENGKKYIGLTKHQEDMQKRYLSGHGYKGCRYFKFAIDKYGWDGFLHIILIKDLTIDEASFWERYFIKLLRSNEQEFGYNIQTGGMENRTGLSEEGLASIREKLSGGKSLKARATVAFDLSGKKIGEFETCRQAAEHFGIADSAVYANARRNSGTCHGYMFHFKEDVGDITQLPEERIYFPFEQKLIRGANSWHSRPVVAFDAKTGERLKEFECIKFASEYYGGDFSTVVVGHHKSSKGIVCRYSEDVVGLNRLPFDELPLPNGEASKKQVDQFDLDGNFIATYSSQREAGKTTGISSDCISQCINDKIKTAGGFIWRNHSE